MGVLLLVDYNELVKHNTQLTLVVPNLKLEQLEWFVKHNWPLLKAEVAEGLLRLVVGSSAVAPAEVASWQHRCPGMELICLERNRGFAHTVNTGFRLAHTPWVGTVNDDVQLSAGWWQACLDVATDSTGSLNPVIRSSSQSIESVGITILSQGKAQPITTLPASSQQLGMVVPATNGACVLYRASALDQVGLFDERFGSYLEDIDLSLRLTRAGFEHRVCLLVTVVHTGHASGTAGVRKAWLDCKNWWLVVLKNWTAEQWRHYWLAILMERGRNLSGLVKASLLRLYGSTPPTAGSP